MKNNFYQADILTVDTISSDDLTLLFKQTDKMKQLVEKQGGDERLKNKILAALFYEPSTRTFSSFIAAVQRLGGGILPLNGMQNTSVEKGESFVHTITVFSQYADIIVLRHHDIGMPKLASEYSHKPVINAGDGIGEHPTQAFFDLYTIRQYFKNSSKLKIALVGDLKNGRTVHSLAKLIPKAMNVKYYFVSPKQLMMPDDIKYKVKELGVEYEELDNLKEIIQELDVIYITRIQKERFSKITEYEKLKQSYIINKKYLTTSKKELKIMHPLPIATGEIASDLDNDPRSLYLPHQVLNGMYLRMALLDLILNKNVT